MAAVQQDPLSPSSLSLTDEERPKSEPDSSSSPPQGATTPKQASPSDPIPDGGLLAWLQVLGSFFLLFNTWGLVNSWGVQQAYLESDFLRDQNPSAISWIGSIQAFLLLVVGVLTGPLFDMGYFRLLTAFGSFLVIFGIMMASLSTEFYQFFLAEGICMGLGFGCLFVPSVAITSTYFSTRRSFALGIVAAGSGVGGVIYPIVFRQLQPKIGFGWALRVMGFIALATLAVPNAVMRTRLKPAARRSIFMARAFKEPPFLFFCIGVTIAFAGLYVPFWYMTSYARGVANTDPDFAFYLLSILNASSIFGRIIPNFFADKTGPFNMLVPCSFIAAILAFAWIGIKSTAGLVVFAILYGFFSGTFVSLPPASIVSISPNVSEIGARMGTSFLFAGIGVLVGTPIAGATIDLEAAHYLSAQIFCAVLVLAASAFLAVARISKTGPHLFAKA